LVKQVSHRRSRVESARAAVRVALWGLAVYAGTQLVAVVSESMSMASAVGQAILAEWGVGRLGVAWSDPEAKAPTMGAIARRAAAGAGVGLALAAVTVGFLVTTRAVLLDRSHPALAAVLVALVTAGLYAMRDELLLHGLVLRVLVGVKSPLLRAASCGVASAAAAWGDPASASPRRVMVQGLLGVVFGALWVKDRGAWPAWGAHTAWTFATALLLQGGAFDARTAEGSWGGGAAGPLGGTAAVLALLPLAFGALAGIRDPRRGPDRRGSA